MTPQPRESLSVVVLNPSSAFFKNHSEKDASDKWKYDFENDYADDFDWHSLYGEWCYSWGNFLKKKSSAKSSYVPIAQFIKKK